MCLLKYIYNFNWWNQQNHGRKIDATQAHAYVVINQKTIQLYSFILYIYDLGCRVARFAFVTDCNAYEPSTIAAMSIPFLNFELFVSVILRIRAYIYAILTYLYILKWDNFVQQLQWPSLSIELSLDFAHCRTLSMTSYDDNDNILSRFVAKIYMLQSHI